MNIKECIDKYLGIPFTHHGRTMEGLDCYGLLILVFKDLGYELQDLKEYDKNWSLQGQDLFVENYQKQWVRVLEPKPFDVVLFTGNSGIQNHAGIYLKENAFLHCIKAGVVQGRFSDPKWRGRKAGIFRLTKELLSD